LHHDFAIKYQVYYLDTQILSVISGLDEVY